MDRWSSLLSEASEPLTLAVLVGLFAILPLMRIAAPSEHRRRFGIAALSALHFLFVPIAGSIRADASDTYRDLHLISSVFGSLALVFMLGAAVFTVALPRLNFRTPRIMQDVIISTTSALVVIGVASRLGINLSGLIATSAVLTAVIGFALQDTLGNIFSGLALQMDDSVKIGDWIKVREHSGRVTEIRWRYTAIETRNWETLVIPNNVLTKESVLILGRRTGAPKQWRRWVYFNIDFRFQPTEVIEAVVSALRSAPIEKVSAHPEPDCILLELSESYCRYAVRYWLTVIADDDPTDSVVRTRIYFALKRVGIPLSMPAHAVFMTKESAGRKAQKLKQEDHRRFEAISRIELFSHLPEEDRQFLAHSLRYAPFTRNEPMVRQGTEAHWLYIIIEGSASVRVGAKGRQHEVTRLGPGSIFGEMSLMTGAPRSATVIALTDVECYRLDKDAFQQVVQNRPEIAETVASILAQRKMELMTVMHDLEEDRRPALKDHESDLLGKIRDFFGLTRDDRTLPP